MRARRYLPRWRAMTARAHAIAAVVFWWILVTSLTSVVRAALCSVRLPRHVPGREPTPVSAQWTHDDPTPLTPRYANDLRPGRRRHGRHPLDDDRFPPAWTSYSTNGRARRHLRARVSRKLWTLISMFPGRPGMTVIGESSGIVMRDGVEVSSSPLDAPTMRENDPSASYAEATSGGWDRRRPRLCKSSAPVRRTDDRFVDGVFLYHRKRVDDQIRHLSMHRGRADRQRDHQMAVYVIGPVRSLLRATRSPIR